MKNKMKIKRKELTLTIFEDTYEDPREYDKDTNMAKMICFHRKYQLGDDHNFANPQEFNDWYKKNKDKVACIMPLYLLDHSGLMMSVHDFHDPWDSGQVGYAYILKETLRKDNISDDIGSYDFCRTLIESEVEEYNKWLCGFPQYYSFEITDKDDVFVDSMGIFEFTTLKEMLGEMKERSEHKYDFLFDAMLKQNESYM